MTSLSARVRWWTRIDDHIQDGYIMGSGVVRDRGELVVSNSLCVHIPVRLETVYWTEK